MVEFYDIEGTPVRTETIVDAAKYAVHLLYPAFLVHLALEDEDGDAADTYMNTTVHEVTIVEDGSPVTYLPVGGLLKLEMIEEGNVLQTYGTELVLSGVPSELVSQAFLYKYRERQCFIKQGLFDDSMSLVAISEIFQGRINNMEVTKGRQSLIKVNVENALVDWDRFTGLRYNQVDQIKEFPLDTGFFYVPEMVEKKFKWGVMM